MTRATVTSFESAAELQLGDLHPGPGHERMGAFVGHFEGIGRAGPTANDRRTEFTTERDGRWLPGGAFVALECRAAVGDLPLLSLLVLGYDAGAARYTLHGFDNRGRQQHLTGAWRGDHLTLTCDTERVEFDLSEAPRTIQAHWQEHHSARERWSERCRTIEHRV